MPTHFSQVICPLRGHVGSERNNDDAGWVDKECVGPRCAKWSHATEGAGRCGHGSPEVSQLLEIRNPEE